MHTNKNTRKALAIAAVSLLAVGAAAADCRNDQHAKATVAYIELPNVPDLGQHLRVYIRDEEFAATKDGERWKVDVRTPGKSFVIAETPIVIYSGETEFWRASGGEPEPTSDGGCVAAYKVAS